MQLFKTKCWKWFWERMKTNSKISNNKSKNFISTNKSYPIFIQQADSTKEKAKSVETYPYRLPTLKKLTIIVTKPQKTLQLKSIKMDT